MSEPIKVGDLVMVIRTCCEKKYSEVAGIPWTVVTFHDSTRWRCSECGAIGTGQIARAGLRYASDHDQAPLSWLKRIPPLDELEGEKRDERLTA